MKISIIVPCYNARRYLKPCVDSILAQTVKAFEVILIDDGSTDDTLELAYTFQKQDQRVKVIHQNNSGVSAARNAGIDAAVGEWLLFVDSDDLLVQDALETMLNAVDDMTDMVVCAHETFDEYGEKTLFTPEGGWEKLSGEKQRIRMAKRLIEGDSVLNIMCNKLHRRALFQKEHLRLKPGLKIAEDALLNLEAVLCGRKTVYVPKATYLYRMHDQSATHMNAESEFDIHSAWLTAMGSMLMKRKAAERYYGAYFDSVVLRLYKDGSITGVMRNFNAKAAPLLRQVIVDKEKLGIVGKADKFMLDTGIYPFAYPMIAIAQILYRKATAMQQIFRRRSEIQ